MLTNGLVVASEANLANVPFADTDIVMMDMHTVSSYSVIEGMLTNEIIYNVPVYTSNKAYSSLVCVCQNACSDCFFPYIHITFKPVMDMLGGVTSYLFLYV